MTDLTFLDRHEIISQFFKSPPDTLSNITTAAEISIKVSEGITFCCHLYPSSPADPILLVFPSPYESPASFDEQATHFNELGISVFVTTYRGQGKSTGSPLLSSLFVDANNQFNCALETLRAKQFTGPIIVMGKSLGASSAIEITKEHQDKIKAIILESVISDTASYLEAAVGKKVEGFPEPDIFNNLDKISKIKIPTLILHGSRDQFIPASQAEKLQSASGAKNKQFFIVPGADHHDIWQKAGNQYFRAIKGFIDTLLGNNNWRERRKKFQKSGQGE